MGSYIERWCSKHGAWEQDVDHPYDECPECEEDGIAQSQKVKRLKDAARALLTRDDFWNNVSCKPGEYDDLKEALDFMDS